MIVISKKSILWIILFFNFFSIVSAQNLLVDSQIPSKFIFVDELNDIKDYWNIETSKAYTCVLKDGRLLLSNKQITKSQTNGLFLERVDVSKDLYIETSFSHLSGLDSSANGLIWNASIQNDTSSYSAFLIDDKKHYKIFIRDKNHNTIIKTGIFDSINPKAQLNKLAILKLKDSLYFYINNYLIFAHSPLPFTKSFFGFFYDKNSSIAIDRIKINYEATTINLIKDWNFPVKKTTLVPQGNSTNKYWMPLVSPDGIKLFFVKYYAPENLDEYFSMQSIQYDSANSKWGDAIKLEASLNPQKEHPRICGMSLDKSTLYINAIYDKNGFITSKDGVSVCHRIGNGWSSPKPITINEFSNLNDFDFMQFHLSADNKILMISSKRKGSDDDDDLYVSFKQGNTWTAPKNLGNTLNTKFTEWTPFLAADNTTLYFSSYGHSGYGNVDIFVTHRLDDTWLNWTKPENLGPYINTEGEEFAISTDVHGEYAYMENNSKIVQFKLPPSARPEPMMLVKGKVFNSIDSLPLSADVIYENLLTGHQEGEIISKAKDGSFMTIFPYEVKLGIRAQKKGFISVNENVYLKQDSLNGQKLFLINLYLTPLKVGNEIVLKNVSFEPDKFDLLPISKLELDRLVKILNENITLTIEIEGHTEHGTSTSSFQRLMDLSVNRATEVKNYLVSQNINPDRITIKGFGNTKPISSKEEENRRVVIKITSI